MNIAIRPEKGTRFQMHDSEYEVQFVYQDNVRFASVKGGKQFKLHVNDFNNLKLSKNIEITFLSKLEITEENIGTVMKKKQFVDALILAFPNHMLQSCAEKVILNVAGRIGVSAPSFHTVKKWIRGYKLHGEEGLIPKCNGNSIPRYEIEIDMVINEEIRNAYSKRMKILATEIHATVLEKLRNLAKSRGLQDYKIPHVRTIQRRVVILDPYLYFRAMLGAPIASRRVRASGARMISPSALSVVQIDTHMMDILVVDPETREVIGRPYLVVILDVYTRMIVGYFVSMFPPSATTTMQAVKYMLLNYGIPTIIIPDRGIEFINSALFLFCSRAKLILELSMVREPNNKAHVESMFATITLTLIQRMEGTTGSNILARGDYNSSDHAVFTLEQVDSFLSDWIHNVYHVRQHSQTGRAPIRVWQESTALTSPLKITEEEIENLARVPHQKSVTQGQVTVHSLDYYSHALTRFNGQEVVVMVDELNLGCVYVSHKDEPDVLYKADSTQPDYTQGLTLNQHKLAREELKALTQADIKALGKNAPARGLALLMQRIKDAALSARKMKKATNGKGVGETGVFNKPEVQEEAKTAKASTRARNAVKAVTQEETHRKAFVVESYETTEGASDDFDIVFD
ncbi:MAG: hypothetical protein EOO53_14320 [Gammaproteobacteria bacterium]|nr:MAG: hypothetical protein EOO53_14320 [Gammaproteobacteria bacterium]